jgi:hypothetical protein
MSRRLLATATSTPVRPGLRELSPFHRTKLAFLGAAFVALVLSVVLYFFVDETAGIFVGVWVPAIHSLGTLVLVGEVDR